MAAWPSGVVALLCLWFGADVTRQWVRKRKSNLGFWSVSLLLSAIASAAYCLTIAPRTHFTFSFYLYYVCGALWMPSIMGLGSLSLVWSKRTVYILTAIIVVIGIFGTVCLLESPISISGLQRLAGGAGTGVIAERAIWLLPLIVMNTFGAIAVLWVAAWSAWKMIRKQTENRFFVGNLALAVGIVVISAAGSAARLGWPAMFWITMLIGWIVTFVGYRFLTPTT